MQLEYLVLKIKLVEIILPRDRIFSVALFKSKKYGFKPTQDIRLTCTLNRLCIWVTISK